MFANGLGDRGSFPGLVIPITQKWYLMPPCVTLHYKAWIKGYWSNLGKELALSLGVDI